MNIVFNIAYNTEFGEDLTLNIINKSSEETQYRMRTGDGKLWTCNLQLDVSADSHICYYYSVVRGENNVIRKEWTVMPHRFDANMTKDARITLYDRWNVIIYQNRLLENLRGLKEIFSTEEYEEMTADRKDLVREIQRRILSIKKAVHDMTEARKVANPLGSQVEKAFSYEEKVRPYLEEIREPR